MSDDARAEDLMKLQRAILGLGEASIELDELGMHDKRDAVDAILRTLLAWSVMLARQLGPGRVEVRDEPA